MSADTPSRGIARPAALKAALERLYMEYDRGGALQDPIEKVRVYADPEDREIAGFVAAGLAFGRVTSILASIDSVLGAMGPSPAAFVRRFDPARDAGPLAPFVHRWTRGEDVIALVRVLQHMLRMSGTLEQFFLDGDDPASPDIAPGLESFCARARAVELRGLSTGARAGVRRFFAQPSAGSACKKLNLYLRWMVRRDEVDLGVWTRVSPSRLVVPLDVHVIRVGTCLGLTSYQSAGWRMAASITASLRELDPADPVRYDFALCHLGMLGFCGFRQAHGDSRCPLRGVCRPGVRRRPASPLPSRPR